MPTLFAQVDPAGFVFDYLVRQLGAGAAVLLVLGGGGFLYLRGLLARQAEAFRETLRVAADRDREARLAYQAHLAATQHAYREQLEAEHRANRDQVERLVDRFQGQLSGLAARHEEAWEGLEGRMRASIREQATVIEGVEKSVAALQVTVTGLALLVERMGPGGGARP